MLRARILAFLAVLLVLVPVGWSAHARYFFPALEPVMDPCCCEDGCGLDAVSCCAWLARGTPPAAVRPDVVKPISVLALLATNAPATSSMVENEQLVGAFDQSPAVPGRGPPLFLRYCAFLI